VLTGAFAGSGKTFHAAFLSRAASSGRGRALRRRTKIGRVEQLRIDPRDPSRIEITFSVKPELPVKTDSKSAS